MIEMIGGLILIGIMIKDLEFNLDEDHYLSDHIIKL